MNSKSAGYPRFRLFTPNPPDFFLGAFADEIKPSGSACIDASRLIFQSAVSFQIRLVAKKQAGPDPLVFLHPSGKTQRIHRTHPKFVQEVGTTVTPFSFSETSVSHLLQVSVKLYKLMLG